MDLGSIENTLAHNICPFIIWRVPTSVSRSNTNKIKDGNLSRVCSGSVRGPWHHLQSVRDTGVYAEPGNAVSKLRCASCHARCKSYIFPLEIGFWWGCSCTSGRPLICHLWHVNGWRAHIMGTSLEIMNCLRRVSGWGRHLLSLRIHKAADTRTESSLTRVQHESGLVLVVKSLHWGGVLLAVPSLQVALSGFPGLELNSRACCLKAFVRSVRCKAGALFFFVTALTMPSNCHLSAASVGSSLFSMTADFSGRTCQSDSWRLVTDAVVLLNSLTASHTVLWLSLIWSDIMGFLVKLDPSWIESLNGQKCLHQTIKSWRINGFSLDFYFNALFDIWMTHISIRIARTANICRTTTASSSSTQCQQHCQAE